MQIKYAALLPLQITLSGRIVNQRLKVARSASTGYVSRVCVTRPLFTFPKRLREHYSKLFPNNFQRRL